MGLGDSSIHRARNWLFPALACLLALFPYRELLLEKERIIPTLDYENHQLPIREFVCSEIRHGRFPHWLPSVGCGTPLHASQLAGVTYPLATPFLLLFGVNYGLRFVLFIHLALGFWGLFSLAQWLGLSRQASSWAALAYILSGFPVAHLMAGHVYQILAFGILPWFFLGLFGLLSRPGPLTAAALVVPSSLLLLAGQPQLAYYAFLIGFVWGLASWLWGSGSNHRWLVLMWVGVASVLTGLIILVQWLPILELASDGKGFGDRGSIKYWVMGCWRPINAMLWLAPDLMGNPSIGLPLFQDQEWGFYEKACYMGVLTPLLVLWALWNSSQTAWVKVALFCFILALIVGLGDSTAAGRLLGRVVPGVSLFRCPGRMAAILSLFASLIAGRGVDCLFEKTRSPGSWKIRVFQSVLAAVLILGLAVWVREAVTLDYFSYARQNLQKPLYALGIFACLSLTVLFLARLPYGRKFGPILLLGVVFGDLWFTQARHIRLVPNPTHAFEGLSQFPGSFVRVAPLPCNSVNLRYSHQIAQVFASGATTVMTNEGGVLPASLERLYQHLADPQEKDLFFRLSSCTHFYDIAQSMCIPIERSLPRYRLAGEFDLQQMRLANEASDLKPATGLLNVLEELPCECILEGSSDDLSLLIVADCYFPGWHAWVNGKEVPIERVHGSFRGIRVPSGAFQVKLSYVSTYFRLGLMGTVAGLAGLFILLWYGLARRTKSFLR